MTRRMRPAPKGVTLAKTSRGKWIALREIWKGDELVDVHPMRLDNEEPIIQERERRAMLDQIERALLETKYREAQRRIAELEHKEKGGNARGTPPARYANVG